jgi:integrase
MTDSSDGRQPHKRDLFISSSCGGASQPKDGHLRSSNVRTKLWLPVEAESANGYPDVLGLRFHDLRHTAASRAIPTGAEIKAVQRMLGHKNASMTFDRYGNRYTEDLNDLADRLDLKFRGAAWFLVWTTL